MEGLHNQAATQSKQPPSTVERLTLSFHFVDGKTEARHGCAISVSQVDVCLSSGGQERAQDPPGARVTSDCEPSEVDAGTL